MTSKIGTVLVTGCNRGIGLEFVKQYLLLNWEVIATCREPEKADDLIRLSDGNPNLILHTLDITNESNIDSLLKEIGNWPLDLLINNAAYLGPPNPQKFGQIDYEMFTRSFEVNAIGPIRVTEKLIKNVRKGNMKKIIFLGSAAGSIAQIAPPVTLYSYRASKAALHMSVHNLYHELKPEKIMVSLINPGLVDTRGFLALQPDDPIPERLSKIVPIELIKMIQEGKIPMITTLESVTQMIHYIENLTTESLPLFVNCDGTPMPW